jgi:hypothetical protein
MKAMMIALVVAALVVPFGLPAAAADLSGKYAVEGKDPNGRAYTGEAAVMRKGDTYQVFWLLGDTRAVGTGILTGDIFAVTYIIAGIPVPGLAIYGVGADGALSGQFTMLGSEIVGGETWRRAPAVTQ